MASLAAKIGTGKHLGFVLLAWAAFFLLAAWVLPPLDSHVRPTPMVYRSVLTLTILLALPTVIVIPAYVYRAWLRFATVPNKAAYGVWVSLESLLLLALPVGLAFWLLTK